MNVLARARWQVLAAALLFSTGGAAIKGTALNAWQVACLRSGVAALFLALALPAARRRWSWRTLALGAVYGAVMLLFVQANKLTTAASTIFLQATAPLYILVLGPLVLREPVRRRDLVFLAAFAGGLVLLLTGSAPAVATAPEPRLGNLLAAAAGLLWGVTVVGLRWVSREQAGAVGGGAPAVVLAGNALVAVVCLGPALPISAAPADLGVVIYLGTLQIGLAYVFLTAGIRHVPALEASLLLLLEPVFNPLWAWWIYGEEPGSAALAGGALIVVATATRALADLPRQRRQGRPAV